jgi:hypothetical protein
MRKDPKRYDEYKAKDRERKRSERLRRKGPSGEAEKRMNRCRVRRHRYLKKQKETKARKGSYRTPQALGKAVRKVKKALPKSPSKRKTVISKLACDFNVCEQDKKVSSGNVLTSDKTVQAVREFFNLDSISQISPGQKDFVIERRDNDKYYSQKRYMRYSLRETHALYVNDHPELPIGLSKFCALRPANVLTSSETPHNICLCQHHENVKFLCECLSKTLPEFPSWSHDFVNHFVCSPESELCMMGNCSNCPNPLDHFCSISDLGKSITWFQWERIDVAVKNSNKKLKVDKRMTKVCKEGSVQDAIICFKEKLPSFLEHVFVKRCQQHYFEHKIANLTEKEAVMQVDFSQNFTCKYQDEVQAANWDHEQVTIFPIVIWTNVNGERKCESHVIVSDDLAHEKTSIAVFVNTAVEKFILQSHKNIEQIFVFSDGPRSQFRNKFMSHFLGKMSKNVFLQWNFFAASHGKGPVDGVGGTVKRVVWKAIKTRSVRKLDGAKGFADVAQKMCDAIKVSYISKEKIKEEAQKLRLNQIFNSAPIVPSISKMHCMTYTNESVSCLPYHLPDKEKSSGKPSSYKKTKNTKAISSDKQRCLPEAQNPNIIFGLSEEIRQYFNKTEKLSVRRDIDNEVEAISKDLIQFCGDSLINRHDLVALLGQAKKHEDRWLTNFVIDAYLSLLASSKGSNSNVQTIRWELFEKGTIEMLSQIISVNPESKIDIILVPCNSTQHWFLLAVLPKEKVVVAMDSAAGDFLKPSVGSSMNKMAAVLNMKVSVRRWTFMCNMRGDVLQQNNTYDCGVFTCMYARSLLKMSFFNATSVPKFRKHMIASLHRKCLTC